MGTGRLKTFRQLLSCWLFAALLSTPALAHIDSQNDINDFRCDPGNPKSHLFFQSDTGESGGDLRSDFCSLADSAAESGARLTRSLAREVLATARKLRKSNPDSWNEADHDRLRILIDKLRQALPTHESRTALAKVCEGIAQKKHSGRSFEEVWAGIKAKKAKLDELLAARDLRCTKALGKPCTYRESCLRHQLDPASPAGDEGACDAIFRQSDEVRAQKEKFLDVAIEARAEDEMMSPKQKAFLKAQFANRLVYDDLEVQPMRRLAECRDRLGMGGALGPSLGHELESYLSTNLGDYGNQLKGKVQAAYEAWVAASLKSSPKNPETGKREPGTDPAFWNYQALIKSLEQTVRASGLKTKDSVEDVVEGSVTLKGTPFSSCMQGIYVINNDKQYFTFQPKDPPMNAAENDTFELHPRAFELNTPRGMFSTIAELDHEMRHARQKDHGIPRDLANGPDQDAIRSMSELEAYLAGAYDSEAADCGLASERNAFTCAGCAGFARHIQKLLAAAGSKRAALEREMVVYALERNADGSTRHPYLEPFVKQGPGGTFMLDFDGRCPYWR